MGLDLQLPSLILQVRHPLAKQGNQTTNHQLCHRINCSVGYLEPGHCVKAAGTLGQNVMR